MVGKLTNWIKNNKLSSFLIFVLLYFLFSFGKSFFGVNSLINTSYQKSSSSSFGNGVVRAPSVDSFVPGALEESIAAPSVELEMRSDTSTVGTDRIVIQNSNLSLVVKNVREVGNKIIGFAESKEGYMVTASYNQPDESPFATITIRVPTKDFGEALSYFRNLAVKVASESLVGRDVTDQYVDIEERLSTLEKTKQKFEAILDQATKIDDILRVQREIIYLQDQIDSYKGQLKAIEKEAELTKVTVYLSTDEFSLPYAPDNKFRPNVVFKLAVRSLLNTLTGFGKAAIWIAVYSVIWFPALVIYLVFKRWKKNKSNKTSVQNP